MSDDLIARLRRLDSTEVTTTTVDGDVQSMLRVRGDVNATANDAADRIEELEAAIRKHRMECGLPDDVHAPADLDLWAVLREDDR